MLVSAMFPPTRTGTSFYCCNLAKALERRGHRLIVVTVENEEPLDEEFMFDVVRIPAIHIPVRNYFRHLRIVSPFLSNYRLLSKLVHDHGVDAIILVNHYLDIAFPAIFAAIRNSVPLLCSVGTPLHSPRPGRDRILRLLDRLIVGNLVFPFCDKIIGWDANILDYLHDVHGNRFVNREEIVIYGVNGDSREFLKHQHDYRLHGQILCVGAVIEQRDYVPMVQAFHIIASDFPMMELKVIGHVYYDQAEKVAKELGLGERVHFVGEQPHECVLQELKSSDLFFASLSGKYLGMGTATLESMLMGVPTLCNVTEDHLGGPILKDLEHIVLARGLEHEFIAARLRQLLSHEDLRRRVGLGGRAFVTEHLNWEKVAQDMEHVVDNVLRAK